MYKIVFKNQNDYDIFETVTFQKVDIVTTLKLFNNDTFDDKVVHSPTRIDKYIPGVLDLTRTYGKDGKFLYLCKPDDKRLPFFIVPYAIPVTFIKNTKYLYITFQFMHWENELPRGSITQNLGCVDNPEHFYEYMLYCKSLNVSIQSFTKNVNKSLKDCDDVIHKIADKYDLPFRKANVFTIDSPGSIDLDDAISIRGNIFSVYIAHVPIIMDFLNLWDSFTNRISNIYLPDKKRSMLPSSLAELCSLNAGCHRICLVMDVNTDTKDYTFSICVTKIKKNYYYDSEQDADYEKISELFKIKKANDLISKIMILFNTNAASRLAIHKNGIYKNVTHTYDFTKNQSSDYQLYDDSVNYLHMTSPIRRMIDILNIYQLSVNEHLFQFSDNARAFNDKWLSQLEYVNKCFKSIKKVQNKCKILSVFENEKHNVYKGYVYDKIMRSDNKYKYQVYLYDLNLIYDLTIIDDLIECSDYSFKLYVFHDESKLRNKVKLQLVS